MTDNKSACDLLAKLIHAIDTTTAANVRHLPDDNISLALSYIVVTREIEKLQRRALGGCAFFSVNVREGRPAAEIERSRQEAIANIKILLGAVAVAEKTDVAKNLRIP